MNAEKQINAYIASQPDNKRSDMEELHSTILATLPDCKLWFLDGKDDSGKIVSNPNIGYGQYTMHLAGGKTRVFYQIGLSANTSGISVYIMGIPDKSFLTNNYGKRIGKASVTSYCIKFKSLSEIHMDVLQEAILKGIAFSQYVSV